MKKQILKAFTMLIVLMTMAFVSAVVSANAQTGNNRLSADVPFDFIVGNKTMTAGKISIRRVSHDSDAVIVVSNADSNRNAIRLTNSVQSTEAAKETRLIFRRYGDKYYLAQIWMSGNRDGRELSKSSSERALERELAASQELASTVKRETVTVIASLR